MFHRISGTTAISGAVDSSFVLTEVRRGNSRAKLSCVGRDIAYRELELDRGDNNVWELLADSGGAQPQLEEKTVTLLTGWMEHRPAFIGTPTQLCEQIDPGGREGITPRKISRLILQSADALGKEGITAVIRRSNGKRIVELHRADRAAPPGAPETVPIAPCVPKGLEMVN